MAAGSLVGIHGITGIVIGSGALDRYSVVGNNNNGLGTNYWSVYIAVKFNYTRSNCCTRTTTIIMALKTQCLAFGVEHANPKNAKASLNLFGRPKVAGRH